ncbi:hypothetical protein V1281_004510 [Nitrobacteraceae bacterium AZCC 2161]
MRGRYSAFFSDDNPFNAPIRLLPRATVSFIDSREIPPFSGPTLLATGDTRSIVSWRAAS